MRAGQRRQSDAVFRHDQACALGKISLFYVVIFPALAAYYCWQKGVEIIGPNRATMFIQLMPLFSAVMAIIIFKEKFELYHLIGAAFIVSGIYLSNKKTNA